jgi:hypothetical protein
MCLLLSDGGTSKKGQQEQESFPLNAQGKAFLSTPKGKLSSQRPRESFPLNAQGKALLGERERDLKRSSTGLEWHACHEEEDTCMSYEEEDTCEKVFKRSWGVHVLLMCC